MKLGTLKDGTRDGALVVVSGDLKHAVPADHIALRLQEALDDWEYTGPQLQSLYEDLNRAPSPRAFEPDFSKFAAPLPRAYQRIEAAAYMNHVERICKAAGAEAPKQYWTEPLLRQSGADLLLGPRDDIVIESEDWGVDIGALVAIVTDDVPMGTRPDRAGEHVRLLMLASEVSLRGLLAPGGDPGDFHLRPACAYAPVAVTPDELGAAWHGGKLHLPVIVAVNGAPLGKPDAGADMTFGFHRLIARAARTRRISAGTILGSGTVSNKDKAAGFACLEEKRALERIEKGEASTPLLKFGDRVRIEVLDAAGRSVFGAIDQQIVQFQPLR